MIFIDTHVHYYPEYNFKDFFFAMHKNLKSIIHNDKINISGAGIILTERNDCNFFTDLLKKNVYAEACEQCGIYIKDTTIHLTNYSDNVPPITLYPARQVSTSEKIEVLALFQEEPLPEGLSLNKLIEHIHLHNAIPVLNWAPGKWLGKRGFLIREFLDKNKDPLLFGITSLLSRGFPYPRIIQQYSSIPVLAGSDPLPFSGQEKYPCSFGVVIPEIKSPPDQRELKEILLNDLFEIHGSRDYPMSTAIRLLKNEFSRKRPI